MTANINNLANYQYLYRNHYTAQKKWANAHIFAYYDNTEIISQNLHQ